MGKSGRPTCHEVRAVARLFGDARSVGANAALQRQILLDGSCCLVNADQGFFSEFDDFLPGRAPKGVATVGSTELDPRVAAVTRDWFGEHAADKDAMGAAVYDAAANPGANVVCWRDAARVKSHRAFGEFYELVATVRLADILDPFSRHACGNLVGMSLHRHGRSRPFDARERAIAQLIAEELQWVHETRRLDVRSLVGPPLSPQLGALLKHLLTERSTKQIAAAMGISIHTARDYTKILYRRLNVDSREQLMARLLNPAGAEEHTCEAR